MTRYSDEQVDIVEAGKVESNAPITFASHIASFDEKILLVSAQANVVKNEMQLTLSWQVMNPTQGEVFRHVLDCEGNVLGLATVPRLGEFTRCGCGARVTASPMRVSSRWKN